MNFKKTWKRGTEGFTLVELIVVIAILAILAGIAVPAYSGYIKKANEAADLQLLGAVNTAFAATVLENGRDVSDVKAANLKEGAAAFSRARTAETGWTVGGVVVAFKEGKTPANFDAAEFSAAFMRYFGNGNAKFKVIELKDLAWDETAGGFGRKSDIEAKGGNVSYVLNGNAITVSAQAVTTLQNSTFGTEMGGEALMGELTGLTNMMSTSDSKLATDLLGNEDYMKAYAAYLGIDTAGLSSEQVFTAVETELEKTLIANGYTDEAERAERAQAAMVNGMVFYAADGMKDYTVESATTLLNSENIYSSLSTDPSTRLAEASLVYGMYAGFVNSEYNKGGAESSTNDPMSAIKNISGTGTHSANFQAYLDSDQGKADIEAYMEAMNVINGASGNDAAASILVNGFTDSELQSLLTQVLGK